MPELLTLRPCHCGEKKLLLTPFSQQHFEVRCSKCFDFSWGNTPDYAVEKWNKSQGETEDPKLSAVQPKTAGDCCKHSMNLVEIRNGRSDVRILTCRICGCKHIRLKTDPGKISGN